MTTRRKTLIAAAVMAMLAPSTGLAQDRGTQGGRTAHCEGAYDESNGTNFGICASPEMGGEPKSPIGEVPEGVSE